MSDVLRRHLIRIAHENPKMREHLLPLLREGGAGLTPATIRLAHVNPDLRPVLLPVLRQACGGSCTGACGGSCGGGCGEGNMVARFEKGKPADPTSNMTDAQKAEWWKHHEDNKDKFKTASAFKPLNFTVRGTPDGQYTVASVGGPQTWSAQKSTLDNVLKEAVETVVRLQLAGMFGPELVSVSADAPSAAVVAQIVAQTATGGAVSLTYDTDRDQWRFGTGRRAGETTDTAKFEEGKPADPTENMTDAQKKEWWKNHEKNKDKFTKAAHALVTKVAIHLKGGNKIEAGTSVASVEFLRERPAVARLTITGRDAVKVHVKNLHTYLGHEYKLPPSRAEMSKMAEKGEATTPTGRKVASAAWGPDGSPSWLIVFGYV